MLAVVARAALDLLLPPSCLACGACGAVGAAGLCTACTRRLPPPRRRCAHCGRVAGPHGLALGCPACAGPHAERDALHWSGTPAGLARRAVSRVVVGSAYAGAARDLVLALKFRARLEAARCLAGFLADALRRERVPGDLLVPVPLSRRRMRERGFNQSFLLARRVRRELGVALRPGALVRRHHGPPQARATRSGRRRGPRGAFRARPRVVRGRCVLLVDDVLTTGATARACALALRRAGAASVVAAVACRADRR